jgi:pyruvate/2-oxoglutarate dehydrogenase complex dihydrolipoamide acyltransferase (E2) component
MNLESTPIVVPRKNVNDETVMLIAWLVSDGDRVEPGQSLAQVETSKAVLEIDAAVAGFLRQATREGEEIAIGGLIGHIDARMIAPVTEVPPHTLPSNGPPRLAAPISRAVASPHAPEHTGGGDPGDPRSPSPPARFSRKARELLEQVGLAREAFEGFGLLRSKDLVRPPEWPEAGSTSPPADEALSAARPKPSTASGVAYRIKPLMRSKRTEAKYLRSAHNNALLSAVTVSCPTGGLRGAARESALSGDNVTAIIVFEAARLLRKYTNFNAFYADGDAHYYEDVNIGFAVDAGRGLKVPVIHHADRKGIVEITTEMRELVVAYLADELPVKALTLGTFTVTDLSGEGVATFHPLINQGQSAILGICAEVFPPGSREGTFNLVLSFDHQLSEGRVAAQFLNDLRERIGSYESVLNRKEAGVTEEARCARCYRTATELHKLDPYRHFLIQTVRSDASAQLICTICMLSH